MKKVCIVTASRSEYGLLRWLIDEVKADKQLLLQLIVTGTHLSPEYGLTYREIEKDGYEISEKIEFLVSSSTEAGIAKSIGLCSISFADVFSRIKPDILVVLGDRFELLSICSVALVMNIPIAHISGGDITEGAIDNQIRNAVTMMASLHFPGNKESAERIERMIGTNNNIYNVGEPGIDNFKKLSLWDKTKLAYSLGLDIGKKWVLFTYHPETKLSLEENIKVVNNIIQALQQLNDIQVIITGANADYGGVQINEFLLKLSEQKKVKYKFFTSLGQLKYMSLMKEAFFIIGNSSSGIVEGPYLGKPVINIGLRQKGRYISKNIINVTGRDVFSIIDAINRALQIKLKRDFYYGNGNTSNKIKKIIKNFLLANK